MLSGGGRAVEDLAFAPVEAGKMTAGERDPVDTVGIDVAAARPIAGRRRFVDFRKRGVGRVIAQYRANNGTGNAEHTAPDRTIDRAHGHSVLVDGNSLVLGWIERLVWLYIGAALAVADRIDDERRPALGLHLVPGRLVFFQVQPAEHAGAAHPSA